ncbi:hypothetical protein GDO81_010587 [Engystomops pustulosus]|uniref:Uncharacterized protein n=1 Tax=Engystomops pustulosus TaxID=76066 RepID=A0AAV7C179_ENGPU|nr:hypothetical protein GDO81_010587 [Engystomops pustulosus]
MSALFLRLKYAAERHFICSFPSKVIRCRCSVCQCYVLLYLHLKRRSRSSLITHPRISVQLGHTSRDINPLWSHIQGYP